LAVVVAAALMFSPAARASDHLTGIVLMTPARNEVVVHHAAFAGMPSMTMTFRVPPGTRVRPGDRIVADVDRATDPWTLSNVRVAGSEIPARQAAAAPFLQPGERVPDMPFLDQSGRRFSLAALAGTPYALTFIYTRCVDARMCPLISAKYRSIQTQTRHPIALVEISLDPAYDRPPVLARYGAAVGADPARWHLLTGDPRQVLDFAARFGILEHSAGPVSIVHSERLAIVGRDGRIMRFYDNAAWSPHDVTRTLQLAVERVDRTLRRRVQKVVWDRRASAQRLRVAIGARIL
jgi:cytochrome oxidase Cu insertion factor (SCO1/SenC/PrrC family)